MEFSRFHNYNSTKWNYWISLSDQIIEIKVFVLIKDFDCDAGCHVGSLGSTLPWNGRKPVINSKQTCGTMLQITIQICKSEEVDCVLTFYNYVDFILILHFYVLKTSKPSAPSTRIRHDICVLTRLTCLTRVSKRGEKYS